MIACDDKRIGYIYDPYPHLLFLLRRAIMMTDARSITNQYSDTNGRICSVFLPISGHFDPSQNGGYIERLANWSLPIYYLI
jgi:hypothetical protein